MSLLTVILGLHSILRWLVIVASATALVWFAMVWLVGQRNEKFDRAFMGAFTGLIDAQVLVGLILLFLVWQALGGTGLPRHFLEHGFTMIVAAVAAHLPMRWRKAEVKVRARNNAILIVAVLVIVFVGISLVS